MNYRVEDGQITMPVSELNRLNDLSKELEKREAILVEGQIALVELQKSSADIVLIKHLYINGQLSSSFEVEKVTDEIGLIMESSVKDGRRLEKNKIKRMSVIELLKYKKSI